MIKVLGILTAAAVIAALEVPRLIKGKLKGELWVFVIILGLGTALSIAVSLAAEMPSPLEAISYIYKPLGDFIFGLMGS